jgi:hypothetical protein
MKNRKHSSGQVILSGQCQQRLQPFVGGLVLLWALTQSYAQGVINISFDGPPYQAPETAKIMQEYTESGMVFTPIDPNAPWAGFVRRGDPTNAWFPSDGTIYLQALVGNSLMFSMAGGGTFDFLSVDLAEYSTVVPDAVTVPFIGYFANGGTITTTRTTDGIIDGTGPLVDFQTFTFTGWTGLTRVEIPASGWSLDNVVIGGVPEPSSAALLLLSGGLLWFLHRQRQMPNC